MQPARRSTRGWPLAAAVRVGLAGLAAGPGTGDDRGWIVGRVTDRNGEALAGVRVTAAPLGSDAPVRSSETEDSDGFQLTGLSAGPYEVWAQEE